MEHRTYFVDAATVVVATSGAASLEGLDAVVAELIRDPRYRPGLSVVLDHSLLQLNGLQADDVMRRVHVPLKEADLLGPRRIAIVTVDSSNGGARDPHPDEPQWEHFTTIDDALKSMTRPPEAT